MKLQSLAHVVLRVRDMDRSISFYRDVLGLKEVGRNDLGLVFFTIEANHHDFALRPAGPSAPSASPNAPGLAHFAWKIGTRLEELREAKAWLEGHGVTISAVYEHRVSQSLYFDDPDGNRVELFVESDPSVWLEDPHAIEVTEPLEL